MFVHSSFKSTQAGFTLVELLASMAIFAVLFGIIMAHHARFGGAVTLNNLAYEIALSVRQAQVYGLSVKEFEPGTGEFHDGYGVHFDRTSDTTYVLFADRDPDGGGPLLPNNTYDPNPGCGAIGSECIEQFTIGRGNRITDICAAPSFVPDHCFSTADIDFLDILFLRPDPDAVIISDATPPGGYSSATITVVSPEGITQDIVTRVTGQISVGN